MTLTEPPRLSSISGKTVLVLGAGMIGICTALELQRRGARVTLIDRKEPGNETSYGNAGVFARSSLFPLNNPGLLRDLPGLLSNRRAALRYDWRYVLANLPWALRFLVNARPAKFRETTRALNDLIQLSIPAHKRLIAECGQQDLLSDQGWVFLYRAAAGFDRAAMQHQVLQQFDVETQELDRAGLQDIEPGLTPIFERALWIKDSYSVRDPRALVQSYAQLFAKAGGQLKTAGIRKVSDTPDGAAVYLDDGTVESADHVAVCLGPWSKALMQTSGYKVQMGFERGYHAHFSGSGHPQNAQLNRPVYDTSGGYVLAPMHQGLRLSSGVELKDCDAPASPVQLRLAETAARQAIDLGDRIEAAPWLGSRPTFPDSRPVIGRAPQSRNVSVAFGHQHIGLATGPGTAHMLADLIQGVTPPVSSEPFRPERFIGRIA
jgi:D-amino-acid dehydrogenase